MQYCIGTTGIRSMIAIRRKRGCEGTSARRVLRVPITDRGRQWRKRDRGLVDVRRHLACRLDCRGLADRDLPRWDLFDCNRSGRRTVLINLADEAKSALVQGADEALVVAAVAERRSSGLPTAESAATNAST